MLSSPPGFDVNCATRFCRKRKFTSEHHHIVSGYGFTDESNPLIEINLVSNSVPLSGTCAGTEQSENSNLSQNDAQSGISSLAFGSGDNFGGEDLILGERNIVSMRGTGGEDTKRSEDSLEKMISPRIDNVSATVAVGDGQINEKSNVVGESHAEKLTTIVAGKLWDGSLQLNSSVTISAVAFFKSGEKMPDVKWSEILEVKGKVRLDAFEKYIADLPRSRNRGLMVISLCCKDGSTKSGLAGLKEVVKGYEKRDRVGLAQLSKGIDLYICPRSDTIITILAKHGFFKGKAAVKDNLESLIGCVVWRRNLAHSDSMLKKSEKMDYPSSEKTPKSPSNSFARRVDKEDSSHAQLAQKPSQVAPATGCTNPDGAGNNNPDSKFIGTGHVQPDLHSSSTNASLLLAASVLSNFLTNQTASISDSAVVSFSRQQSLHAEAPNSLHEKPKQTSVVHRPGLPLTSHVIKGHIATPDDDLPEFDFGTACGIPQSLGSKLSESDMARIERKLLVLAEELKQIRMPATVQPILAPNQSGLGDVSYPGLPVDVLKRLLLQKEIGEKDRTTAIPSREEKLAATAVPHRKNLFDDEDDMPEWCPPNIELCRQLLSETRPTTTSISSKLLNSSHGKFSLCLPGHSLPSPSQAAYPPPFTRASGRPINQDVKPAQSDEYALRGRNTSFTRFNAKPILRPPLNSYDARVPDHPAGWRDWTLEAVNLEKNKLASYRRRRIGNMHDVSSDK